MTPDPAMLVHLCGVQEWSHARERGGIYPESDKTGYIHLSTLEQVHLPANRLYRGRADLVLLYIDRRRSTHPCVGSRACLLIRGRCFSRISTAHCRCAL